MIDIRLPSITATDDSGKLQQITSYLYQMRDELNFALKDTDAKIQTAQIALANSNAKKKSDIEEAVDEFNKVKNLIIKSADIVNAYYDIFQMRLDGKYVAESDFGTFVQETNSALEATSNYWDLVFSSMQIIQGTDDNPNQSGTTIKNAYEGEIDSTFYMKIGWLDDTNTLGGIEIGQYITDNDIGTTKAFSRYTPDALTFYDDENDPVAWFSNQQLNINYAEIKQELRIGDYIIKKTPKGLAFKFRRES